ncbi:MAG: DUF3267 domain-containing protein [Eubacteriales bacterium]
MRFLINEFPNMDFEPEKEGYTRMKEPSMEKLLLIAFPVGLFVCCVLFFLAQVFTQTQLKIFYFLDIGLPEIAEIILFIVGFVVFNVLITVLHEGVHALFFPEGIRSERVGFGFHKTGAFFAFYTEALSKNRMIITMLMPFVLFTLLPWLLVIILDCNIPLLMMALLYHAFLASGDLVGLYLVIKNTPRNSVLKNKGYYTYYK